jgi:multiple sugar transport system permease protein
MSGNRKFLIAAFLVPALLFLLVFLLFPLGLGFYLSFLDSGRGALDESFSAPFVEFSNYRDVFLFHDGAWREGLWDAVRNTIVYTACVSAGTIALGLMGALLIFRRFKGHSLARTLLLLSWIVPSYVVGVLWGFMWQQEEGIINTLLFDILRFDIFSGWFGVQWDYTLSGELLRPRWLTGENTIWAIIIPAIWHYWPFAMIMFFAGLSAVPREIYEAAELDGAGKSERFFYITLPVLRPVLFLVLLQSLITSVYSFNMVSMMFGSGAGFPGKYGDLIMTYLFRATFQMWNPGTGMALSTLLMGVMAVAVVMWYHSFRKDMKNV